MDRHYREGGLQRRLCLSLLVKLEIEKFYLGYPNLHFLPFPLKPVLSIFPCYQNLFLKKESNIFIHLHLQGQCGNFTC